MKKALIIIDMQNDFITGSLKNPMAEAIVKPIAELAESFDGKIIATRDTHGKDYLDTPEGKALPVVHCVKGTYGHEIEKSILDVINKKGCLIIDKPAFGTLDWKLDEFGEVVLVGTCTDICVITNALIIKTLYPSLKITVLSKLCAGVTEEKHQAALEAMRSCQIIVE